MNKEEIELEDSIDQKFLNNLLGTLTVEEAKYVLKKGTGNFCDEVIECAADVLIEGIERLEGKEQKLIELNDKYLQKLVYALTPTQHALGDNYNNAFKKIIADNIDLETCKIKRLLKECWGIDKY